MRDKPIHAYFELNKEILWQAVTKDIPPLKKTIEKVLHDEEKNRLS